MTAIPKPQRGEDPEYRKWIASKSCLLLGRFDHICSGPVEAHHVIPDGGGKVGSKVEDRRCVPFCEGLHRHYHILGSQAAFEKRFPVLLDYEISKLNRAYRPPVKRKRKVHIGIQSITVSCRCTQSYHNFPFSKVLIQDGGVSWDCPRLNERIEAD